MSRGEDLRERGSGTALFRLQPKDLAVVDNILKLQIFLLLYMTTTITRVNLIFVLVFNSLLMATFHMMTKMKMMSN